MVRLSMVFVMAGAALAEFDDSAYMRWFEDALDEVHDHKLEFEGELPQYVRGQFVQSGPGRWSMGNKRMMHSFDGYAKIARLTFGDEGVTFSNYFLRTNFYNKSVEKNTVVPAILMGKTDPPASAGPGGVIAGSNDNNYIKCQKVGHDDMVLSDTPVAVLLENDFGSFDEVIRPNLMGAGTHGKSWNDHLSMDTHICASGIMAHGQTDPLTGHFIGELSCMGLMEDTKLHEDYHILFKIDPAKPTKRELLAKIKLPFGRKMSYMHSMAFTPNYIVLGAQPLHMSVTHLLAGQPMADGAIVRGNSTLFQIVSRKDGSVRQIEHPGFTFAHVPNAWEEGTDIVMDLGYYENDERMAFLGMFKFENLVKEVRDKWQKNKLMRFRLGADGSVDVKNMLPNEPDSMFELFNVNERMQGQRYCVLWSVQSGSNAYDEEWNSTKVGPAGAYGLAKRNLCTGERRGFYAAGEYPSETQFIPNPEGTDEDDGVLVGIVWNSNTNTSFVQVVNASTMQRMAKAELHMRVNFLVHSTWFSGSGSSEMII